MEQEGEREATDIARTASNFVTAVVTVVLSVTPELSRDTLQLLSTRPLPADTLYRFYNVNTSLCQCTTVWNTRAPDC